MSQKLKKRKENDIDQQEKFKKELKKRMDEQNKRLDK